MSEPEPAANKAASSEPRAASELEARSSKLEAGGCLKKGCLVVVVVTGVLIAALAGIYFYIKSAMAPRVEQFQAALDRGDDEAAYALLGDKWRAKTSYEAFSRFASTIRDALGPCQEKTLAGLNFKATSEGTFASLTYNIQFAKGLATVKVTLEKTGGKWVVQRAHYESELLIAALKCPHCGVINERPDELCSKCREPMRSPPKPSAPPGKAEAEPPAPKP